MLANSLGERYSFWQLLKKHQYRVEIPLIQRDYAQGRPQQHEVRDAFLEALSDYLREGKPNRDLDFVYGYTQEDATGKVFIPLDGQQRLTTLFLLHWYLAKISDKMPVFLAVFGPFGKSRFTYKVRTSSAEFCDALLSKELKIGRTAQRTGTKISAIIRNKSWFFNSWNSDPTIQAMLNMLDAIESTFCDHESYFEKLISEKEPVVTFLHLDLDNLHQSDDLYIKMNSRGKPLTDFENFKAKFEQHIGLVTMGMPSQYTLTVAGEEVKVTLKEYFSFKIDSVWSNTFWCYRKLVGDPNSYDDEISNFIRVILANEYALSTNGSAERLELLYKSAAISFSLLQRIEALGKDAIISLVSSFDAVYNGSQPVRKYLSEDFYFNEEQIFKKVVSNTLSYPERVQYYAYVEYLKLRLDTGEPLQDWMRVVHNLVENSRIENVEACISALKAVKNLLEVADEILVYLNSPKSKVEFFFSEQVREERIKARLIAKSETWKAAILNAEQNLFHKGQIFYLLEFSGIIEAWNTHSSFNWSIDEEKRMMDSFISYTRKSSYLFSILDNEQDANYLLERALLSKGDYLIPASRNRYNFCSSKIVANYERDYSWKRLLRNDKGEQDTETSNTWQTRRDFVRQLLDDKRLSFKSIQADLESIASDQVDDWRAHFMSDSRLIESCRQGFIFAANRQDIQLLNASQMNHLRSDMMTYVMYLDALDNLGRLEPFKNLVNVSAKGYDEDSFGALSDWCYKRVHYAMYFNYVYRYDIGAGEYILEFKKAKGESKADLYDSTIIQMLDAQRIRWNDEYRSFVLTSRSRDVIRKAMYTTCRLLQELENGN